jgi:hypothetical protein
MGLSDVLGCRDSQNVGKKFKLKEVRSGRHVTRLRGSYRRGSESEDADARRRNVGASLDDARARSPSRVPSSGTPTLELAHAQVARLAVPFLLFGACGRWAVAEPAGRILFARIPP